MPATREALLARLAALGITTYILLQRAEPMLRAAIIDQLEKQFHAKVELDALHVVIKDGFSVHGEGLRIWLPADNQQALIDTGAASAEDAAKPWIVVGQMRLVPRSDLATCGSWECLKNGASLG